MLGVKCTLDLVPLSNVDIPFLVLIMISFSCYQDCYLKYKIKKLIIYKLNNHFDIVFLNLILIYFVHLISTGCTLEGRYRNGSTLKEVEDAFKMCLRINIDSVDTKIKRLSRKVMEDMHQLWTIKQHCMRIV